jgi:anti-anti-sigma factor
MNVPYLAVAATREGQGCVLTIAGDLDLTTAAALIPALTQAVGDLDGQTDHVILDLSGLAHLDINGARALVTAVRAMPGGHPVIVRSISPIASRLLGLLGWNLEAPAPTADAPLGLAGRLDADGEPLPAGR